MLGSINDYKNLKKSIVRMYKNHVTEELRSSDGRDTDVHKESKD